MKPSLSTIKVLGIAALAGAMALALGACGNSTPTAPQTITPTPTPTLSPSATSFSFNTSGADGYTFSISITGQATASVDKTIGKPGDVGIEVDPSAYSVAVTNITPDKQAPLSADGLSDTSNPFDGGDNTTPAIFPIYKENICGNFASIAALDNSGETSYTYGSAGCGYFLVRQTKYWYFSTTSGHSPSIAYSIVMNGFPGAIMNGLDKETLHPEIPVGGPVTSTPNNAFYLAAPAASGNSLAAALSQSPDGWMMVSPSDSGGDAHAKCVETATQQNNDDAQCVMGITLKN